MASHGTGPPCPGPQFGTLILLVMLQPQPWAGPAGSCCAHPTRPLQTGRRFLPRLLLTHIKAHAQGNDSLPLLHTSRHSHGITIIRQGLPAPEPHYSHTYTHPQTTPAIATTLSKNSSCPDMAPVCCKAPLCICRLPGTNGIPSQCHKLLS